MKMTKVQTQQASLKTWCPHCSIRVAPSEEKITVSDKTFHTRCYLKLNPVVRPPGSRETF